MRWVKQALGYRRSGIDEKTAGKGVCAAILDTGIAQHPDLDGRIADFKDFTGRKSACYDDSGHGTHVAGILAGNGKLSAGMYSGMAPAATLLAAKVLDRSGNGNVESVLRGIEWLKGIRKEHPLRIVNISVGTQPELKEEQKARLLSAVEELWDEGYVIVTAAGNMGPAPGSIKAPGSSRKVITVGSSDLLEGEEGISGSGPTSECVCKPDVVAPGARIMSCAPGGRGGTYAAKSGTSMSTPQVAGAIALMLEKEPELTNVEIKMLLRESARDLGYDRNRQGWGLFQKEKFLEM